MRLAFFAFLLPLAATIAGTRAALAWLRRKAILDHPNERSSHCRPTPRGGGLAVTPVILLSWIGFSLCGSTNQPPDVWVAILGGTVLFALSWFDDKAGLPARLRLVIHGIVVAAGLAAMPDSLLICQGWLPLWADRLLAFAIWLWFVNLFNFMDGIDGITGVETAAVAGGITLVAALTGAGPDALLATAIGAAGLGFLVWNWHPAKIFLGDSGSVPLGYLLGWLLLRTAGQGQWAPALILPAYYLADATLTLGKRAMRGEKLLQAHRQHFYQKAVRGGASHAHVAAAVLSADVLLVILALFARTDPWPGLAGGLLVVAILLGYLAFRGRKAPP
jgi:UDP-N-acetylmuramyl pentapeptide phosphotransferase/UDP-N-acetylglucosamine-1-phosphate transferase